MHISVSFRTPQLFPSSYLFCAEWCPKIIFTALALQTSSDLLKVDSDCVIYGQACPASTESVFLFYFLIEFKLYTYNYLGTMFESIFINQSISK